VRSTSWICPGERPGKANNDRFVEGLSAQSPIERQLSSQIQGTAIVISCLECMKFMRWIIESIDMNSSDQYNHDSTRSTQRKPGMQTSPAVIVQITLDF
jgi:hypothetical protein